MGRFSIDKVRCFLVGKLFFDINVILVRNSVIVKSFICLGREEGL